MATIKRFLSNSDTAAILIKNKLFDALVKPILLYGCEIWEPEILSYQTRLQSNKFILSFVKKHLILHGIEKTQPVEQNVEDIL